MGQWIIRISSQGGFIDGKIANRKFPKNKVHQGHIRHRMSRNDWIAGERTKAL
jgi:hypothetical protein